MQRWVTQNKSQDCLGSLKKQGSWPSLSLQRHFTSHPRGSFSSKNKWLCPRYLTLSWRYSLSRWPWDALIMSSPDMRAHLGSCHYNHLVIKPSLEQKWWITAPAVTHLQCRPETDPRCFNPHSHLALGDLNRPHRGVWQGWCKDRGHLATTSITSNSLFGV